VHRLAHEVAGENCGAAGRQNLAEAIGNFPKGVLKQRSVAQEPERQQQQGEKSEEHVEGDGLAERHAIWKYPASSANEIPEYPVHRHWAGLYGNTGNSRSLFHAATLAGRFRPSALARRSTHRVNC